MKKTARRQFAMNTLYSIAAIGFGLGAFEGKIWPLFVATVAYALGYAIARRIDSAS